MLIFDQQAAFTLVIAGFDIAKNLWSLISTLINKWTQQRHGPLKFSSVAENKESPNNYRNSKFQHKQ